MVVSQKQVNGKGESLRPRSCHLYIHCPPFQIATFLSCPTRRGIAVTPSVVETWRRWWQSEGWKWSTLRV